MGKESALVRPRDPRRRGAPHPGRRQRKGRRRRRTSGARGGAQDVRPVAPRTREAVEHVEGGGRPYVVTPDRPLWTHVPQSPQMTPSPPSRPLTFGGETRTGQGVPRPRPHPLSTPCPRDQDRPMLSGHLRPVPHRTPSKNRIGATDVTGEGCLCGALTPLSRAREATLSLERWGHPCPRSQGSPTPGVVPFPGSSPRRVDDERPIR